MKRVNWLVVSSGIVTGLAAVVLTALGNPANMGFCIACFQRDIAGALGLHSTETVQYLRFEVLGLVLGACLIAVIKREFRPKAGSSPATRFVLGMVVMLGALVFLGCPLRLVLRLGGGDFHALAGLVGFITGTAIGVFALKHGCSLKRAYPVGKGEGGVLPLVSVGLLLLGLVAPTLLKASTQGPASMHAPVLVALGIALVVGVFAQRSRLCMVGGIRDWMLFGDGNLLSGFLAIFVTVLVGNLALGQFNPGFGVQPIAHSAVIWNFLGMVLVGWGSVLLGGCPLRQLILAGEGNGDSAVTVFGMVMDAAVVHNFELAGTPDTINAMGGVGQEGQMAVALGFVVLTAISWYHRK